MHSKQKIRCKADEKKTKHSAGQMQIKSKNQKANILQQSR